MGYQPDPEHPELFRLIGSPVLQRETNNLSYFHAESGMQLELHWRCHQFTDWPELFQDESSFQIIDTSIGKLKVPTEQRNLLFLAIHGSLHRWSRLKWLFDLATLAEIRGPKQLESDLELARQLGAGGPLELGLCLSSIIFGTSIPGQTSRPESWLVRQCLIEINRPEAVPKSIGQRIKFYAMMLAMADGPRQRLGILRYRFWGKNRIALANHRRTA